MVQEFHVVRCFSCQTFQVQQVKKQRRWVCKLRGETQSLLKEFGRGSGADCRRHVQKLNASRGAALEEQAWSLWEQGSEDTGDMVDETQEDTARQPPESRWAKYLDPPPEEEPEEEGEEPDRRVWMDRQALQSSCRKDKWRPDRKRRRRDGRADEDEEGGVAGGGGGGVSSGPSQRRSMATPPSRSASRATAPPPTSQWTRFLSAARQEREEPSSEGRSLSGGRACSLGVDQQRKTMLGSAPQRPGLTTDKDTPRQACPLTGPRPPAGPRPLLAASSLFDTGEDFSLDDAFP